MRVDVHTLSAFNGVAQRGAEAASGALRSLTGESTDVDIRGVNIAPASAVHSHIDERQAAVMMELSGGVTGRAILTFSPSDAGRLRQALPTHVEDPSTAVLEVGNILIGRLLDDIANGLGTGIDASPPTGGRAGRAFGSDATFLFECKLLAPRLGVAFDLYLRLRDGAFDRLLERESSPVAVPKSGTTAVSFNELSQFAQSVSSGVNQATTHASTMTGLDLSADPRGLRFVTLSDLTKFVADDGRVGTAFSLSEPPGGFVVITFDQSSADHMGRAMIPGEASGGMVQDAMLELGNVMTSGLIDGWEPIFNNSIDHSAPVVIGGDADDGILDPFLNWLGREREYGFLVDATIETPNGDIGCDIYAMPDELELLQALDAPS